MDSTGRYTWGRRGFAAAAITGGMLGVAGASGGPRALSRPSAGDTGSGDTGNDDTGNGVPHAVPPPRSIGVAATSARYSAPLYHTGPGSSEFQLAEIADQARPGYPAGPVPVPYQGPAPSTGGFGGPPAPGGYPAVSGGAHAAPKHSAPERGQGADYVDLNRADDVIGQTVGLSGNELRPGAFDVERTVGLSEEQRNPESVGGVATGSDGYLAGNATALAVNPSTVMSGPSAVKSGPSAGAMDPGEAGLGTGFGTYGATGVDAGRGTSRHARPEPGEQPLGRPVGESDTVGLPTSAVPPGPLPSAEPHYPGQPPARQQYTEPRYSDARHSGAHHAPSAAPSGPDQPARPAQFVDSETSALGSLDSSGLFGSLSSPPR